MPKVVLVGDEGSGKTSLRQRFVDGNFSDDESSTIGVNFINIKMELHGKIEQLAIWDVAGQERYINLIHIYVSNRDGIIINVDLAAAMATSDPVSTIKEQMKKWRDHCLPYAPNAVFAVSLNKSDLVKNIIPLAQIQAEANQLGIQSVNVTSAKDNKCVREIFIKAAEFTLPNEPAFQSGQVINIPGFSDMPNPDEDKEALAAAKRQKFLTGARNFLLGLLIVGVIVGTVMLFVFPPAGLATLLATTVVGSLTVGAVAGIGAGVLAALALIGTVAYSFFKRNNTEPKQEKLKELDLEIAETPSVTTTDPRDAIGAYPQTPAQIHLLGRTTSGSTAAESPESSSDLKLKK